MRRSEGTGGGPDSGAGTDGMVSEEGTWNSKVFRQVDQNRGPSSGQDMRHGQQHLHPEAAVLF